MTIAELMVQIGVKGADATGKALDGVKKGLGSIVSSSLETKAAIAAVVYGLSRLTSHSAELGQSLKGFSDLTGLSADRLQRWQYMAKLSGGSAEDMMSSVKSLQKALTQQSLGNGPIKGMEMLGRAVRLDPSKLNDTFYMMDKLREFSQKFKGNKAIGNEVMGSFGLSEKTMQSMYTSNVDLDKISPSKLFTDNDISRLSKVNQLWEDLWHKVDIFMGKMVGKEGLPLVQDLSKAADAALKLANALIIIVEKLHLIAGTGKVFDLVTTGINKAASEVDYVNNSKDSGLKKAWNVTKDTARNALEAMPITHYFRMIEAAANKSDRDIQIMIHNYGVKDAKDANTVNTKSVKGALYQNTTGQSH